MIEIFDDTQRFVLCAEPHPSGGIVVCVREGNKRFVIDKNDGTSKPFSAQRVSKEQAVMFAQLLAGLAGGDIEGGIDPALVAAEKANAEATAKIEAARKAEWSAAAKRQAARERQAAAEAAQRGGVIQLA